MVNNPITRGCLERGEIKHVGVSVALGNNSFAAYRCRLSKWVKVGDEILLKLKTGKDYPLGHKYIWRSLEEVI